MPLATVNVSHELSKEIQDARQAIFDNEIEGICKKYLENGYSPKRGFVFNESSEMNGRQRTLHHFSEHMNIPLEMQEELAIAWIKLFD